MGAGGAGGRRRNRRGSFREREAPALGVAVELQEVRAALGNVGMNWSSQLLYSEFATYSRLRQG